MNLTENNETQVATQSRRTVVPRHTIQETPDAFVVTALLPGVARDAVETQLDGRHLTVLGRKNWTAPTGWTPVYQESQAVDYQLVLELDHRFDRDAVRAELQQGVLTLTLPKAAAAKPRRIEIAG